MQQLASFPETLHGHRKRLKFFLSCLEAYCQENKLSPAEVRSLDVGCGNGEQLTLRFGAAGYQVTGIDFHEPSIRWAQEHNRYPNVRFVSGDVNQDLPTGEVFDVVVLSDILEHVDDPGALLQSAKLRLKPGGILLISIPNGYGPFEIESFLIRKGILKPVYWLAIKLRSMLRGEHGQPPFNSDSGHVQWFTQKRFTALLEANGFRVTQFRKGAVSGGDLSAMVVGHIPPLVRFGVAAADYLPAFMSSVWHWEARLNERKVNMR